MSRVFKNTSFKKLEVLASSVSLFLAVLALIDEILFFNQPASLKNNVMKWTPNLLHGSINERMYTHETSGKGYLNLRQTCVVESAAKNNPTVPIHLFLKGKLLVKLGNYGPPWLEILSHYPNIVVMVINETDYFKGTPLEEWYEGGKWKDSEYWIEHMADYVRMLSVWRNGGMYFDLDIVMLQPIDFKKFRNFFIFEDNYWERINNAIFHLEHGHEMNNILIEFLANNYNDSIFTAHGPDMITALMKKCCGFRNGDPFSNQCKDLVILPQSFAYPVPFDDRELLIQKATKQAVMWLLPSYGIHLWNKYSRALRLDVSSDKLFSVLATEHCPVTVTHSDGFFD